MAELYTLGPALVLYGDPTQASGAGMNFLGHVRGEITVNPNLNISFGRVDARGMIPLADAVFNGGAAPVASIPFVDEEKAKLKELLPGSSIVTNGGDSALVLGSGVKKVAITELKTLCIIPLDEIDEGTNGIEAPNAWWFNRAVTNQFGSFRFSLPEGEDNLSNKTRDTQIASLYHSTDMDGNTVPANARAGFRGSPNALSLTWSLPDLSAFV